MNAVVNYIFMQKYLRRYRFIKIIKLNWRASA